MLKKQAAVFISDQHRFDQLNGMNVEKAAMLCGTYGP